MGDVLFRWRSYMPLVLVPLFVFSIARRSSADVVLRGSCSRSPWRSSGLVLRIFVVGTAPPGASTRGTRQPDSGVTLDARRVLDRSPSALSGEHARRAWVLACSRARGICRSSWLLLSFIYHERIAAREELFLEHTFGDGFRAWANRGAGDDSGIRQLSPVRKCRFSSARS